MTRPEPQDGYSQFDNPNFDPFDPIFFDDGEEPEFDEPCEELITPEYSYEDPNIYLGEFEE